MKNQNKQHFSHHHILIPLNEFEEGKDIKCKACDDDQISGSEPCHGCLPCSFYLHSSCVDAPRSLQHPSHPSHPLTLLPISTYSTRSFTCDACRLQGKAYSYTCAHCEFDLHVKCALLHANKSSNDQGKVESDQNAIFEAERELREQRIAHQIVLDALDSASEYVGSSYTKRYYYY
ncbi:hypothetical protein ACJIZ3_016297 [Penstemon smallii]|uniref:DC1 domain-containing protein n=1 Tax=Penstemon smallii TaxID=265156 RepID=A0ABD3RPZ4_9LAMI